MANIPYGITSEVLKCLMFEHVGNFTIGSVVMQSEPAKKLFSGRIYNPFTVFYHTFYDLKLLFEVSPESFFPPPTVGSALLRIERKVRAMNPELKVKYLNFVAYLLHKPELPVKTALKTLFRKKQVRSISEKFGIQLNIPIACLTADQWKNCFFEMLKVVPGKFHPK